MALSIASPIAALASAEPICRPAVTEASRQPSTVMMAFPVAATASGLPSLKTSAAQPMRPGVAGKAGGRRRFGVCRASDASASVDQSEAKMDSDVESASDAEAPGPAGPIESLLADAKEAYESGEEAAVAAVEAQIRALDADRVGLADRLDQMTAEISAGKDRFLRLNADFDNFRKRSEREKLAMAATVRGEVIEALLPMVDSFERAKSGVKAETEAEKKIDGAYQGIYRQFVDVVKGLGVTAVETVGKEFDPMVHEAIMREDSDEFPEGVVSLEFRKGFVIGDKLIRPAMVKVSSGPGPAGAGAAVGSAESTDSEGSTAGSSDGDGSE